MSGRPRSIPTYRRHRQSGQAVVTLTSPGGVRKDILLGSWNTKASRAEYARVIAEWEAAGQAIPLDGPTGDITINEVAARFMRHARRHYRYPDGRPTSEIPNTIYTLRFLLPTYGSTLAAQFGPLALKAVRQKMIEAGLCRKQINRMVGRLRRIFKWAVSEELIPPSVLEGLRAVAGLLFGRTEAKESEPVKPVPDAFVDAVLPHVARSVAGMIEMQRCTGMRPGEVIQMRMIDVDTSGTVWLYKPPRHKMSYRGTERIVALGPKAQSIVREFLTSNVEAYLFSPRRDHEERSARLAMTRKSKRQPSQQYAVRRKRKPAKQPGECWRRDSYTQAIHNGCHKAGVPVWGPNRLRHNFATAIRKQYGLEAAQAMLGHARADVTQVYAERNQALAEKIAALVG